MMANERIPFGDEPSALMHLIEAFPLKGMSGSAVCVRETVGVRPIGDSEGVAQALGNIYLLGLVRGYFTVSDRQHENWHTGMSMVVPSAQILEIMNQKKLKDFEKRIAQALEKHQRATEEEASIPNQESASGKKIPIPTVGDFVRDLTKATWKREKN